MITLRNEWISVAVKEHGAELASLKKGDHEYLWQADPAFWARHSPVLFPIVGNLYDKVFRMNGVEYGMGQHGFARDCDFALVSATDEEVWMRLESNEETLAKFPAAFCLMIGYRLEENRVHVMWRVENPSATCELPFQIGAHPAFYWPEHEEIEALRGYFKFEGSQKLTSRKLVGKGCVSPEETFDVQPDDEGLLRLDVDTFDEIDTIILEKQVHSVALCHTDGRPMLKVCFDDAPVVGMWSPPGKRAPFVCIEPWYGRCDSYGYAGEFKDREWVNVLAPGETFEGGYSIEVTE